MSELTLKDKLHYYYPHNLKIQILNANCDYVGIKESVINGYYFLGDNLHVTYEGGSTGKSLSEFKPHFRHISDLTKEIIVEGYNEGKPFVPIVELLKIKFPYDGDYTQKYGLIEYSSDGWPTAYYKYSAGREMKIRTQEIMNCDFWIIQLLFSWHFWIWEDGYFDQGLILKIQ